MKQEETEQETIKFCNALNHLILSGVVSIADARRDVPIDLLQEFNSRIKCLFFDVPVKRDQ